MAAGDASQSLTPLAAFLAMPCWRATGLADNAAASEKAGAAAFKPEGELEAVVGLAQGVEAGVAHRWFQGLAAVGIGPKATGLCAASQLMTAQAATFWPSLAGSILSSVSLGVWCQSK